MSAIAIRFAGIMHRHDTGWKSVPLRSRQNFRVRPIRNRLADAIQQPVDRQ